MLHKLVLSIEGADEVEGAPYARNDLGRMVVRMRQRK
jgi:hypothetical protein